MAEGVMLCESYNWSWSVKPVADKRLYSKGLGILLLGMMFTGVAVFAAPWVDISTARAFIATAAITLLLASSKLWQYGIQKARFKA
jgi:hypothetical protein